MNGEGMTSFSERVLKSVTNVVRSSLTITLDMLCYKHIQFVSIMMFRTNDSSVWSQPGRMPWNTVIIMKRHQFMFKRHQHVYVADDTMMTEVTEDSTFDDISEIIENYELTAHGW